MLLAHLHLTTGPHAKFGSRVFELQLLVVDGGLVVCPGGGGGGGGMQ